MIKRAVTMVLDDYLKGIPDHRLAGFNAILKLIRQMYPNAIESMKYKMPTFENGNHQGDKPGWIALANQKSYVSVYTCMEGHLVSFKERHPNIKTGKGCINFRDKDEIPLQDLKLVIASAMEYQHD